MKFATCGQCGAIVAVSMPGFLGIDNRDMHEQWHQRLNDRFCTAEAG